MKRKDWRNLLILTLAATLCLGGSFTCSTDDDDDKEVNGFVTVNAVLWW